MFPVRASPPSMMPKGFRVLAVRDEIPGCKTLELVPETDCALGAALQFSPGQFYMLYGFGHGEVPISVSGDGNITDRLTFTIMAVGPVTQALCSLKVGEWVGLRGPFGRPWPLAAAAGKEIIIMAGGLGLAPLRPLIYQFLAQPDQYPRVSLLYGSRQPKNLLFMDQLMAWQQQNHWQVSLTVDAADRDWHGRVGLVTNLLANLDINPSNSLAYICGPEIMMRFSAYGLLDRGLAAEDIYLSMERNMKCAIKTCGRCQYGPYFVCSDGPVFPFDQVAPLFKVREV